jgi:hypothetical protein
MHWKAPCGTWHATTIGKCDESISNYTYLASIDILSWFVNHSISNAFDDNFTFAMLCSTQCSKILLIAAERRGN